MALSNADLASKAHLQLKRAGVDLPADATTELERLVGEGFDKLYDRSGGHDPKTWATGQADRAVMYYAQWQYMGHGEVAQSAQIQYENAFQEWSDTAAKKAHKSEIQGEKARGEFQTQADRIQSDIHQEQVSDPRTNYDENSSS